MSATGSNSSSSKDSNPQKLPTSPTSTTPKASDSPAPPSSFARFNQLHYDQNFFTNANGFIQGTTDDIRPSPKPNSKS